MGCETFLYDDYKIIDLNKFKYKKKEIRNTNQNYIVKKGDNLYSISRKFKIPIHQLIKSNNILEPYNIYPNQKIFIPTNKVHKIIKGDTLYSISRLYGTNVFSLSKINGISDVNNLHIGQTLIIPQSNKEFFKKKILEKKKKQKVIIPKKFKKFSQTRFIWPVKGKLISKYGRSEDGFYNDGINIDSKKGTKVISSEDGQVIYSGNEIPGYGNLILIKHSKNWITAYAHLNEVYIEKGIKVKKGERIGSVGNTGNVRIPQLHFEIRKGKESVNPLEFL